MKTLENDPRIVHLVLETMAEGVIVWTKDARVQGCNPPQSSSSEGADPSSSSGPWRT